jgi:hypothetical protein
MAEPQAFVSWRLPGTPPAFEGRMRFTFTRPGRLRALAGWFHASMAPGVVLETTPGHDTHWYQIFMPLPATWVEAGDALEIDLRLEGTEPEPQWGRVGRVIVGGEDRPFELHPGRPLALVGVAAPEARWHTPEGRQGWSAEALNELGGERWVAGDQAGARALFEDAVKAMTPKDDGPGVWENLGIARHAGGDWTGAIDPLLRALDGDLTSREQSLRLLVDACMRARRQGDGGRYLAIYQAAFGPHPAGWAR